MGEEPILANSRWAGEKSGVFEHPAGVFPLSQTCRQSKLSCAKWLFRILLNIDGDA
jgi:hypothetical protein